MDNKQAASKIRDHLLPVMRRSGEWRVVGSVRLLFWKDADFTGTLNTPFNPLGGQVDHPQDYQRAVAMQRARTPLPNSLSLWVAGKGKVLSCEWSDGEFRVISFKRGDWEKRLLGEQLDH